MGVFAKLPCGKRKSADLGEPEPLKAQELEPESVNPNQNAGRIQWSSPTEFILTCIGYSVGLGNVWRFPYLCYKSGGGAFLIPYVIMIVLIGMPLLFMEYGFGQYFGIGSLSIYKKVCPMLQGIGIGYTVLNALVCIYYNVIIALSLYYIFASFQSPLPWSHCGNEWNTPACGDPVLAAINNSVELVNQTMTTPPNYNMNTTMNITVPNITRVSPSDEYFRLALMNVGEEHNISNIGHIQWRICLCLLLAWVLVVLFVSKGIKSTGKVAYFTATFPYVMLTVLVVRGVTLPGATDGILYFVSPDFSKLKDPEVWFAAATQLFYSTNLAWGGMITMSSYNSFSHNCYRDALMINCVSFLTSIYAGFAVFSIIGYMAGEYNREVADIIDSGPALAFIVYPRALSLMPLAPMWSALFFFMLFLLGIGSQMVQCETIITALVDNYERLGKNWSSRICTVIGVAVICFLLGLPITTQGGMYVLQLMDHYSATFCVLIIAICECVCINWIYGIDRFSANIKEMLGIKPNFWWKLCWRFISPLLIVGILVFSFIKYTPAKYGKYYYPGWADFVGWCMTLASVIPIFAVAIYKFIKADGSTFIEKLHNVTKPIITIEEPNPMSVAIDFEKEPSDSAVTPQVMTVENHYDKDAEATKGAELERLMTKTNNREPDERGDNSYV